MSISDTIYISNTGETIKNEFFILNTPGKILKIQNFIAFYNVVMNVQLPNFIKNNLPISLIEIEGLLDNYRQNNFPKYPSRLACFFAFDNLRDVLKYKEENYKDQNFKTYKIQISSDNYKVTKHNMEYVSILRTIHNWNNFNEILEKENFLYKYWSCEKIPFDYSKYGSHNGVIQPTFEYLIEGDYICSLVSV